MNFMLIVLDQLHNQEIEVGELLTVVVVKATNVIKDIVEGFKDTVGGRMRIYEELIQDTVDTALRDLDQKAKDLGYDGVIGIKIANPTVAKGGAEVVVYGNGFRFKTKSSDSLDLDLESQGIDREQAQVLRTSLATFSEDWDSPEMSIYDDYDAAKANS